MAKTYTYDPAQINQRGKDRMRFELGDVMVEGGAETCALTDEEYNAIIPENAKSTKWKRAKLALLESILMRFAYEVNTTAGPLSLQLQGRVAVWKQLRDDLAAELSTMGVPRMAAGIAEKLPYFYEGMHENQTAGGTEGGQERND